MSSNIVFTHVLFKCRQAEHNSEQKMNKTKSSFVRLTTLSTLLYQFSCLIHNAPCPLMLDDDYCFKTWFATFGSWPYNKFAHSEKGIALINKANNLADRDLSSKRNY